MNGQRSRNANLTVRNNSACLCRYVRVGDSLSDTNYGAVAGVEMNRINDQILAGITAVAHRSHQQRDGPQLRVDRYFDRNADQDYY